MICKHCKRFMESHERDCEGMYILERRGKAIFKTHEPICAFNGEVFSKENWSCMTLNILREASNDEINENPWGLYWRSDDIGTISVIPVPDKVDIDTGFIILVYYKERGKVDNAIRITDEYVEPLRKSLAERMADWLIKEGYAEGW